MKQVLLSKKNAALTIWPQNRSEICIPTTPLFTESESNVVSKKKGFISRQHLLTFTIIKHTVLIRGFSLTANDQKMVELVVS